MTATVVLPGGVRMPMVGLGTAELGGDAGYRALRTALDAGYRHLDTATAYRNEREVGRAVRDSGLDRDEVFLTTKLPPADAGRERQVLEASLRALGVDHVDLWLVHWPTAPGAAVGTWRAFLAERDAGRARAVGVSNHDLATIDELVRETGEAPAVNQVPWWPGRHEPAVLAGHRERGMVTEGYSPLCHTDLHDPALGTVARAHGVTPAQAVLRWHLQHGIVVIPMSADAAHQRANLDLDGFALTGAEMATLDALGSRG